MQLLGTTQFKGASDSALLLIGPELAITQLNRDYSPAEYRNNLEASC